MNEPVAVPGGKAPRALHSIATVAVVGLALAVVLLSTIRSRTARAAPEEPLPSAAELTPVPMATEITGAPTRAPLNFTAAFADTGPRTTLTWEEEDKVVARARLELAQVSIYDSSWMETSGYPLGDVPQHRGACTDVVVRSLRAMNLDLQELVHDDVLRDPGAYGVTAPDPNNDHRRLGMMLTFFQRHAMSLTTNARDKHENAWRPGDIVFVAWSHQKGAAAEHVGIISDKKGPRGLPLVIENGGPKPVESDSLGKKGKIVAHFRALKKRDDLAGSPVR